MSSTVIRSRGARGNAVWRDTPVVTWLLAALVVAAAHRVVDDADWLLLHLVLLGALTQAITVWSWHFAQTLLHSREDAGHRARQAWRVILLNVGALLVVVGVPLGLFPLTLVGGSVVSGAAAWHAQALWADLRRALPARFRVAVHAYIAAAASLLVGAGLGATLAGFDEESAWHAPVMIAHAMANLLGWVGFTVVGTLLTLWPTMLRTRMDDRAERWTRRALPILGAGVALAVCGPLLGLPWLAGVGVGVYVLGLLICGRGLWLPLRTKGLHEFAPASVGASLVWLLVGLAWAGAILATGTEWEAIDEAFGGPAAVLAAGFGIQILIGALSYLVPSIIGGGPSVVRAGQGWLNRWWATRVVIANVALVCWLAPLPQVVRDGAAGVGIVTVAAFLPLLAGGVAASRNALRGRVLP